MTMPTRREILHRLACGFGSIALSGLLADVARSEATAADPLAPKSSEAPKGVVTATDGSVHGAGTLSSPIVDQPGSIHIGGYRRLAKRARL
ncbi:MAG TPA: hypothetical protein VK395_33015 [Gemmataceae bacterium]|nr:hypothetical protein [Gemmataceae bacterium]